jgi:hypothetical protein
MYFTKRVVLAGRRKMYFMKSAAEYGKSAPNDCFCRTKKNVFYEKGCSSKKQKNVFYEKRNSHWNICSAVLIQVRLQTSRWSYILQKRLQRVLI